MHDVVQLQSNVDDNVIGFIEHVNESGLHGWAIDREAPQTPVKLLLLIDDHPVAELLCAGYRPDVARGGQGGTSCGFNVSIPREYCDGQVHRYAFATLAHRPVSLHALGGAAEVTRGFRLAGYFDHPFYTRQYPEAKGMSKLEAWQHWQDNKAETVPNEDALFAGMELQGEKLPALFSAILYGFLIGVPAAEAGEAAVQFLRGRRQGKDGWPRADREAAYDERFYASFHNFLRGNGIVSDIFLTLLNVPDYVAANPGQGLATPLQCAHHFVTSGRLRLAPLSFRHVFDRDYLAERDRAYEILPPEQAYLRWLNEGIAEGVPPNRILVLEGLRLDETGDFPAGFDAGIYLARNPDLRNLLNSRWGALHHYVTTGAAEGRPGCPVTKASADLHRAVADAMTIAGELGPARLMYEKVLERDPDNLLAQRHYGDCLLREEDAARAARIYRASIENKTDNNWTHINLSLCLAQLEQWAESAAVLLTASASHPEDQDLWERAQAAMREAYANLAAEADWQARQGFYAQARETMREACAVLAAPFTQLGQAPGRAPSEIRRLAIVADTGLPQCNLYRVQQKAQYAKRAGLVCDVYDYLHDTQNFISALAGTDAVIFYRVPANPDVMAAIFAARRAGLPVFYEIDDLMFDETLFPARFESYSGHITHDLYASLVTGAVALKAALQQCDYALASTPALADAMAPHVHSRLGFALRNALGAVHEAAILLPRPARAPGPVRLFYGTGTTAHNEDFAHHLAPQLARLLKKWGKQIELCLIGSLVLPDCLLPFAGQISQSTPEWDVRAYWRTLGEMDINLAVLKPGQVEDAKSEIKWLEAAMLGIPSVVSATRTYREVIVQGRTGLLVTKDEEWFTALDRLIADPGERQRLGTAAREAVLRDYAPAPMAGALREMLTTVTLPARPARRRILITHVFFDPQRIGGATRVVIDNLRDLLATHGDEFEFEVFATIEGAAEPYRTEIWSWEGVRVTAVTTEQAAALEERVWDDRMGVAFAAVLERFGPELVHFHCLQRLTLSVVRETARRSIPYFITAHDGWWLSDEQFMVDEAGRESIYDFADPMAEFRRGGSARLERLRAKQSALAGAEKILAVSESFGALYRRQGFANTAVVENGVSHLPTVKRVAARDHRVRLAHIGGARPHKGFHLVQAALFAGGYQNLHLLVIDHAMDAAAVRRTRWGTTPVTLRGKLPQAEVGTLYGQVDVLLAPSVWPESYGLVTREALLAGCWVVASDRGAIGQDVTPQNGFIVDASSPAGLAAVLAEIDANPARFSRSPKARFKPRYANAQAQELAQLYKNLLGTGPAGRPSTHTGKISAET